MSSPGCTAQGTCWGPLGCTLGLHMSQRCAHPAARWSLGGCEASLARSLSRAQLGLGRWSWGVWAQRSLCWGCRSTRGQGWWWDHPPWEPAVGGTGNRRGRGSTCTHLRSLPFSFLTPYLPCPQLSPRDPRPCLHKHAGHVIHLMFLFYFPGTGCVHSHGLLARARVSPLPSGTLPRPGLGVALLLLRNFLLFDQFRKF